jgi:hypothetical protein
MTVLGQTKRRTSVGKTNIPVKFAFQAGVYTGEAKNTTTVNGHTGRAESNLLEGTRSDKVIGKSRRDSQCPAGRTADHLASLHYDGNYRRDRRRR